MGDSTKKVHKIVVDRTLCIGAASCVVVAGTVFELDAENKAVIARRDGSKDSGPVERATLNDGAITDNTIIMAAQSCPTKAIFLYDEQGGQIYP
jgi:ferredoxin